MKLVILGATGPSGQVLVTQALEAGHEVTAVVRNPDKMKTTHEKLKVVVGDIFSADSLKEHMTGQDAVLSCLGSPGGYPWTDCSFYSDTAKVTVEAMKGVNITRFIPITSWCTNDEKGPFFYNWIVKPLLIPKVMRDMGLMESYLAESCPDINYTVVKPPGLSNGEKTDKQIKAIEEQYIKDGPLKLARADVARFMLDCLGTSDWDRKLVSIGY